MEIFFLREASFFRKNRKKTLDGTVPSDYTSFS